MNELTDILRAQSIDGFEGKDNTDFILGKVERAIYAVLAHFYDPRKYELRQVAADIAEDSNLLELFQGIDIQACRR